MEFKLRNSDGSIIDATGTYLQDIISVNYKKLVEVFGYPETGDGYKVDAEWTIMFEDKTIATIYNYKDGKNYNGDEGMEVEDITNWHIGGYNNKAVEYVLKEIV